MVISEIYLTQKTYTVPPVVHAIQGETGRILWMYLQDTQLSDYDSPFEAGLYFKRSDGTYYNDVCMTYVSYNRCEAALDQALTQPGITRCQLKITDAAGECSTYDFNIIVHESMNGVSEEQLGYSLEELQEIIAGVRNAGLTEPVKQALLACFNNVAWKIPEDPEDPSSTTGEDLIDALESALYPPAELQSITATYTQSGTVYDTDSLDSLKADLVVTSNYDNGTSATVTSYTLSGTLTEGTSTITVSYGGKTATFSVVVKGTLYRLSSPFTSTGSEYIDTGVKYPSSGIITIAEEFTITSYRQTTVNEIGYIFGTRYSATDTDYLSLQENESTTSSNIGTYLWGVGITWSNGKNITSVNDRIKMVHTITMSNSGKDATISTEFKNITKGTTNTFSNTYSATNTYSAKNIIIGTNFNLSFHGTLYDMIMTEGQWTSEEIAEYLAT